LRTAVLRATRVPPWTTTFVDANVLLSAPYRSCVGLGRLWVLPGARLLISVYAAEEACRNLSHPGSAESWRSYSAPSRSFPPLPLPITRPS
jgi:hypothetical protein